MRLKSRDFLSLSREKKSHFKAQEMWLLRKDSVPPDPAAYNMYLAVTLSSLDFVVSAPIKLFLIKEIQLMHK